MKIEIKVIDHRGYILKAIEVKPSEVEKISREDPDMPAIATMANFVKASIEVALETA